MSDIFFNTAGMRNIRDELSELSAEFASLHHELTQIRNKLDADLYQRFFMDFLELDDDLTHITNRIQGCTRYLPGAETVYASTEDTIKSDLAKIYAEYYRYHTKLDIAIRDLDSLLYTSNAFDNDFVVQAEAVIEPVYLPEELFEILDEVTVYENDAPTTIAISASAIPSLFLPEDLFDYLDSADGVFGQEPHDNQGYMLNDYRVPDLMTFLPIPGYIINSGDIAPIFIDESGKHLIHSQPVAHFVNGSYDVIEAEGSDPVPFSRPVDLLAFTIDSEDTTPGDSEISASLPASDLSYEGLTPYAVNQEYAEIAPRLHAVFQTIGGFAFADDLASRISGNGLASVYESANLSMADRSHVLTQGHTLDGDMAFTPEPVYSASIISEIPSALPTGEPLSFEHLTQYAAGQESNEPAPHLYANFQAIGEFEVTDDIDRRITGGSLSSASEYKGLFMAEPDTGHDLPSGLTPDGELAFTSNSVYSTSDNNEAPAALPTSFEYLAQYTPSKEYAEIAPRLYVAFQAVGGFDFADDIDRRISSSGISSIFEYANLSTVGTRTDQDSPSNVKPDGYLAFPSGYMDMTSKDGVITATLPAGGQLSYEILKSFTAGQVNLEIAPRLHAAFQAIGGFVFVDDMDRRLSGIRLTSAYEYADLSMPETGNRDLPPVFTPAGELAFAPGSVALPSNSSEIPASLPTGGQMSFENLLKYENAAEYTDAKSYSSFPYTDVPDFIPHLSDNDHAPRPLPGGRLDYTGLDQYSTNGETVSLSQRAHNLFQHVDSVFSADLQDKLIGSPLSGIHAYVDYIPTIFISNLNHTYAFSYSDAFRFIPDEKNRLIPVIKPLGYLSGIDDFTFEYGVKPEISVKLEGVRDYTDLIITPIALRNYKSLVYTENEQFEFISSNLQIIPQQSITEMIPFIAMTYFLPDSEVDEQIEHALADFQSFQQVVFMDETVDTAIPRVHIAPYYEYLYEDEWIWQDKKIEQSDAFGTARSEDFVAIPIEAAVAQKDYDASTTETSTDETFTNLQYLLVDDKQIDTICKQISTGDLIESLVDSQTEADGYLHELAYAIGSEYPDHTDLIQISSALTGATVTYIADDLTKQILSLAVDEDQKEKNDKSSADPHYLVLGKSEDMKTSSLSIADNALASCFDLEYKDIDNIYSERKHAPEKKVVGDTSSVLGEVTTPRDSEDHWSAQSALASGFTVSAAISAQIYEEAKKAAIDNVESTEHELTESKRIKLYLQNLYEQSMSRNENSTNNTEPGQNRYAHAKDNGDYQEVNHTSNAGMSLVDVEEISQTLNHFRIRVDEETADKLAGIVAISVGAQVLEEAGKHAVLKFKKTEANKQLLQQTISKKLDEFNNVIHTMSAFIEDIIGTGGK